MELNELIVNNIYTTKGWIIKVAKIEGNDLYSYFSYSKETKTPYYRRNDNNYNKPIPDLFSDIANLHDYELASSYDIDFLTKEAEVCNIYLNEINNIYEIF